MNNSQPETKAICDRPPVKEYTVVVTDESPFPFLPVLPLAYPIINSVAPRNSICTPIIVSDDVRRITSSKVFMAATGKDTEKSRDDVDENEDGDDGEEEEAEDCGEVGPWRCCLRSRMTSGSSSRPCSSSLQSPSSLDGFE